MQLIVHSDMIHTRKPDWNVAKWISFVGSSINIVYFVKKHGEDQK